MPKSKKKLLAASGKEKPTKKQCQDPDLAHCSRITDSCIKQEHSRMIRGFLVICGNGCLERNKNDMTKVYAWCKRKEWWRALSQYQSSYSKC